jgi:transcriptional regulator with XRE-family HTH domain
MTGHHPFAELRAKMSPEARALADQRAKELSDAIDLAQLRRALRLSQQQLAKKMRVNQPEIAKIEKRADMLLSTLGAVLRAMGADLKIVASFPNHDIQIRSLGKLANGARDCRERKETVRLGVHRSRRKARLASAPMQGIEIKRSRETSRKIDFKSE